MNRRGFLNCSLAFAVLPRITDNNLQVDPDPNIEPQVLSLGDYILNLRQVTAGPILNYFYLELIPRPEIKYTDTSAVECFYGAGVIELNRPGEFTAISAHGERSALGRKIDVITIPFPRVIIRYAGQFWFTVNGRTANVSAGLTRVTSSDILAITLAQSAPGVPIPGRISKTPVRRR